MSFHVYVVFIRWLVTSHGYYKNKIYISYLPGMNGITDEWNDLVHPMGHNAWPITKRKKTFLRITYAKTCLSDLTILTFYFILLYFERCYEKLIIIIRHTVSWELRKQFAGDSVTNNLP